MGFDPTDRFTFDMQIPAYRHSAQLLEELRWATLKRAAVQVRGMPVLISGYLEKPWLCFYKDMLMADSIEIADELLRHIVHTDPMMWLTDEGSLIPIQDADPEIGKVLKEIKARTKKDALPAPSVAG